jgi:hypothetical protein
VGVVYWVLKANAAKAAGTVIPIVSEQMQIIEGNGINYSKPTNMDETFNNFASNHW